MNRWFNPMWEKINDSCCIRPIYMYMYLTRHLQKQ